VEPDGEPVSTGVRVMNINASRCLVHGITAPRNARSLILAVNIKTSGVKIYTIQFVNVVGPPQSLRKELIGGPYAPYQHYTLTGHAISSRSGISRL